MLTNLSAQLCTVLERVNEVINITWFMLMTFNIIYSFVKLIKLANFVLRLALQGPLGAPW